MIKKEQPDSFDISKQKNYAFFLLEILNDPLSFEEVMNNLRSNHAMMNKRFNNDDSQFDQS